MLPSDSCQAAIQSDTQRDTAGRRKEAARRSRQSEEEKDNGAAATLTGQWAQTDGERTGNTSRMLPSLKQRLGAEGR